METRNKYGEELIIVAEQCNALADLIPNSLEEIGIEHVPNTQIRVFGTVRIHHIFAEHIVNTISNKLSKRIDDEDTTDGERMLYHSLHIYLSSCSVDNMPFDSVQFTFVAPAMVALVNILREMKSSGELAKNFVDQKYTDMVDRIFPDRNPTGTPEEIRNIAIALAMYDVYSKMPGARKCSLDELLDKFSLRIGNLMRSPNVMTVMIPQRTYTHMTRNYHVDYIVDVDTDDCVIEIPTKYLPGVLGTIVHLM